MPNAASGSRETHRWREMDSNFRFLVARPSNRHGRSDCFLETWSGSVGEPEIRIHLPPARSPLRTGSNKPGAGAADPWGAHLGGVDPTRNRKLESISLHQRVINEPGRANWAINSPVTEEDCYLLANAFSVGHLSREMSAAASACGSGRGERSARRDND